MQLRNQKGQMTIEMVLLAVTFVSAALIAGNFLRQYKVMQAFTQGPFLFIQGMTQSGVWATPARAKVQHPNLFKRVGTVNGDGTPPG